MVRRFILTLAIAMTVGQLVAQNWKAKVPPNKDAWVNDFQVSANGRFIAYQVSRRLNDQPFSDTLCLAYQKGRLIRSFYAMGIQGQRFSERGDEFSFLRNDTLVTLQLSKNELLTKTGVRDFHELESYRVCSLTDSSLSLRNSKSGQEFRTDLVTRYWISPDNRTVFFVKKRSDNLLHYLDLSGPVIRRHEIHLANATPISQLIFDHSGRSLAFGQVSGPISYYDLLKQRSRYFNVAGLELRGFTPNGKTLIGELKAIEPVFKAAVSQIYSYLSYNNNAEPLPVNLFLNVETGKATYLKKHRLEQGERGAIVGDHGAIVLSPDSLGLQNPGLNYLQESDWNFRTRQQVKFFRIADSSFLSLPENIRFGFFLLSPSGRYVLYYDTKLKGYMSLDVASNERKLITNGIRTDWRPYRHDTTNGEFNVFPENVHWTNNDLSVIIQDQFDVWELDPSGQRSPICLTGGYGKAHQVSFFVRDQLSPDGKDLLLFAFDQEKKDSGFFKARLGRSGPPESLHMGPFLYDLGFNSAYVDPVNLGHQLKARKAKVWFIQRESETAVPNFFSTTDLKHFEQVTFLKPDNSAVSYRTELFKFRTAKDSLQGVLYKPADLDPNKKYPVIIHYYEKFSDDLHRYVATKPSFGDMNIPWMVGRGYLVFAIDIRFETGYPGRSALIAAEGAADRLKLLPFVDSARLGLQGHSFGGFATNYIITHSNRFAAACSAAGISDYTDFLGEKRPLVEGWVDGQGRLGRSIAAAPELYIENSPIYHIKHISTPLLMSYGTKDNLYKQGVQFFNSLRRAGKQVWALSYEGQGHNLSGEAADDYTVRMGQFFDHYLKGMPATVWMTRPSEQGFEADMTIKTPGEGLFKNTTN